MSVCFSICLFIRFLCRRTRAPEQDVAFCLGSEIILQCSFLFCAPSPGWYFGDLRASHWEERHIWGRVIGNPAALEFLWQNDRVLCHVPPACLQQVYLCKLQGALVFLFIRPLRRTHINLPNRTHLLLWLCCFTFRKHS